MRGVNILKHLYNESGYSLFLTVFTALLFGILATILLSLTISGAKKSELREDVTQAHELSEKGLKEITQQINYDLQEELDKHEDGMSYSDFIDTTNEVLDKYKCGEDESKQGETGTYQSCVLDNGDEVLPRNVTFKSNGVADDQEKEMISIVAIGGDPVPDSMEYAVNTFITKECAESPGKCKGGEGNLFLHGGVGIQGDINVGRNLITSNRSHEKYASHHWIHSYFPSSKDKADGSASTIAVGEDVYTVTWNSNGTKNNAFNYAAHINSINIPETTPYNKMDVIDENVFVGSYVAETSNRTDQPGRYDLDINGEKEKYEYRHDDPGVTKIETKLIGSDGIDKEIKNVNYQNEKVFPMWYKNAEKGYRFFILGESTFKQFATYGDIRFGRTKLSKNNVIEFKEGAYIGGNLRIGHSTEVKGPIYVNGDLFIDGDNVTLNSVMYVNGDVHIKHATLDETIDSQVKGTFVIYSNGKIVVERTNRFNDYPAEMNAYLYSKESIEMDGNESNINIKGGLSAPRIVLNSIRGRTKPTSWTGFQTVEARGYEGSVQQKKRDSRLQIIYDQDVMDQYSDLLLESRIKLVPPAKVVDIIE